MSLQYTNKESEIGFKLSHYYAHCRDKIVGNTIKYYCLWLVYSFVTSIPMYYIPFYAYNMNSANGKGYTEGLWAPAFCSFAIMVTVHHILTVQGTRNWTRLMICAYIISYLLFFPVTVYLNDLIPGHMYKSTFTEILAQPQFWLAFGITCAIITIPYQALNVVWK